MTDASQYQRSFRGPGKYDGSVVNWVNGAVLAAVGRRNGYEVEYETFTHREGSNIMTHDRAATGVKSSMAGTTTATRRTTARAPTAKASPARKPLVAPLATSVVGSYSVPEWLERLKTDYYQRRISSSFLREIHEVAIKAAIKDQEEAGVDVVSDGELRRDNDIDYFLARMPGVEIPQLAKEFYADYYTAVVEHAIPEPDEAALELVEDFKFTRIYTDHPIKFSFTGPYSLSRRVKNEYYKNHADLVMAFARQLNREAIELAKAGVTIIQIDEPYLAGYPDDAKLGGTSLQRRLRGH